MVAAQAYETPQPVQPADFTSPDGNSVLHVDPTHRFAAGAARYRMQRAGAIAWEGERPITLLHAVVADDGRVAGNALTLGTRKIGEHVIGMFDAAGVWREIERFADVRPPEIHGPPIDAIQGFAWNAACDTIVAAFSHGSSGRPTRVWRASTGEKVIHGVASPNLPLPRGSWVVDLQALPSTPLFFARVRQYESGVGVGYRWLLVDAELEIVWDLKRGNDLQRSDGELTIEGVASAFRPCLGPGASFEVLLVRDRAVATFDAIRDPKAARGWSVVERSRRGWDPEGGRAGMPVATPIALELVAGVALGEATGSATPVHDVAAWQPLAANRVEFVRREREGAATFVRLGPGDAIEVEHRLPSIECNEKEEVSWFPLAEGDWIAVRSEGSGKGTPMLWRVDPVGGSRSELAYDGDPPTTICAAPDGGFVVLGRRSLQFGFRYSLTRCDEEGQPLWAKSDHSYTMSEDPTALDSPEDIACLPDGRVAVLQTMERRVQIFDAAGAFERAIELEKAWGREPNYPSDLRADGADGLIVHDFEGTPPVWRMALDGGVRASWQPTGCDGRRLQFVPCRAPDGALWVHEGGHFFRLDAHGREDLRLGPSADPARMVEPGVAHIDGFGRVLVVDEQGGRLHAFDVRGQQLFVGRPDPNDYSYVSGIEEIRASAGGDVYVESFQSGVVHYRGDGTRVAKETDDGSFAWTHDGKVWRRQGAELTRGDASGAVDRRVERDGDSRFFVALEWAAAAPSGELALFDSSDMFGFSGRVVAVDREGRPSVAHAIPTGMPIGRVATNGRWIASFQFSPRCGLLDVERGVWREFVLPEAEGDAWAFGFSKDGVELWAASGRARRLLRYRLPSADSRSAPPGGH